MANSSHSHSGSVLPHMLSGCLVLGTVFVASAALSARLAAQANVVQTAVIASRISAQLAAQAQAAQAEAQANEAQAQAQAARAAQAEAEAIAAQAQASQAEAAQAHTQPVAREALDQPGIITHSGIDEGVLRERFEIKTCADGHSAVFLKQGAPFVVGNKQEIYVKGRLALCCDIVVEKGGCLAFYQLYRVCEADGRGNNDGCSMYCGKMGFWDNGRVLCDPACDGPLCKAVDTYADPLRQQLPLRPDFTRMLCGGVAMAFWRPEADGVTRWTGDLILKPVMDGADHSDRSYQSDQSNQSDHSNHLDNADQQNNAR